MKIGKKLILTFISVAIISGIASVAINQVTLGVEQISSVVQTNCATAEESAAASEDLSEQAQTLKGLIKEFELSNQKGRAPKCPA